MNKPKPDMREVDRLSALIWPLVAPHLAGLDPALQSAVLADLTAVWLVGHIIPDKPNETKRMREDFLRLHIDLVRDLIPINEAAQQARARNAE